MSDLFDDFEFETRAIRAGVHRSAEGEHAESIHATSSYVFASAAEAAARFSGERPGNVYSRFTNPTVRGFEERLASLEGGERCVATASGMAAILSLCLGLLKAGDHIVTSRSIFGSTTVLFERLLSRFAIETTPVAIDQPEQWRQAVRPTTRLFYLETPSNPLAEVADIALLAGIAHQSGALLAVDNVFCTPALQRPLELGADLVVHSATKYIDGQGRLLGGAVVGRRELVDEVFGVVRTAGPSMSPFNAWVFNKGLETLALRMAAHSAAALDLARWLEQQPAVERVYYPGLESHPHHQLATRQQSAYGGVLSFDLKGGQTAAWRLIDQTRIFSITANLGDTRSTITHPATTTHGRLTAEQRAEAGIGDGLVRLSVGLEAPEDLKRDLIAVVGAVA